MFVNSIPSENGIEPEVIKAAQEGTYSAAFKLVARTDDHLTCGIRHYRIRNGQLLTTLDEVVRAILPGPLPEEV